MKTHLSLFLALALSLTIASCGGGSGTFGTTDNSTEVKTNDWAKERLGGKVKSIRQRVYWALEKFGRMDKGKLQNIKSQDYLKEYNEDGFLTAETFFDVRDSVVSSRKITYTDAGQIEKEEYYDAHKLSTLIKYTYDNKKLQQKEISDGSGKLKERYAYSYYDNGALMDEDKFNASNQLSQKIIHTYDAGNKLTEKQYFWGGGTLYKKETLEYKNAGIASIVTTKYQKKEEFFDGMIQYADYNSFMDYEKRYLFDKNEQKVEVNTYGYDKYGNLTLSQTNKRLKVTPAETSASENNTLTQEDGGNESEGVDNESEVTEGSDDGGEPYIEEEEELWDVPTGAAYEYQYDEQNNWTQKITYKIDKGEPIRQFYYERVVLYY
ncbi:hypothetical protein FACS1894195_3310 [Bacteroidia bacterium]|nr:hypothetical protein FACS1894195_3310 [Bacteroidia bacterium]